MRARRSERGALAAAALLVTALSAERGGAYCRTAVCSGASGQRCVPAQTGDCGTPLRWSAGCLGFSVNAAASKHADLVTTEHLMETAFAVWEGAVCSGGAGPSVRVFNLCAVNCDKKQYNQQGANANIVVYRDAAWPYTGAGNTLALTTVTYNLDDGSIFDADMEINGTVDLTVGDGKVDFDLQSIVTHEAGHMLGLAHSADKEATMFINYVPGDVSLRTLAADDMAAICAAYPPGRAPDGCDPTPRHGFSGDCDAAVSSEKNACEPQKGCGCDTAGSSRAAMPSLLLLALATVLGTRRRAAR